MLGVRVSDCAQSCTCHFGLTPGLGRGGAAAAWDWCDCTQPREEGLTRDLPCSVRPPVPVPIPALGQIPTAAALFSWLGLPAQTLPWLLRL